MSDNTKIQWAHHTGGPYLGCSPVSPGCANCYAWDLMLARLWPVIRRAYKLAGFADWETRPVWGDQANRVLTKAFWRDAIRLNNRAGHERARYRMFPSMIDWLDEMPAGIIDQEGNKLDPIQVLADFLDTIRQTENLDWLLLTKRTQNWLSRMGAVYAYAYMHGKHDLAKWLIQWRDGHPPKNVWIGATVENQEYADKRIPELLKIPAVCRFLSYEPALGPVDFSDIVVGAGHIYPLGTNAPGGKMSGHPRIHWIICGGESGSKARLFNIDWGRSTIAQCQAAGVACFVKQLGAVVQDRNDAGFEGDEGEWPMDTHTDDDYFDPGIYQGKPVLVKLRDKKGGDMTEWPEDLRIRQFPSVNSVSQTSVPSV